MLAYIKIAGKEYPMSFSLMASKQIAKKYGSVDKGLEKMMQMNLMDGGMDVCIDMLEILICQGCAYKNYFEKDMPAKETDPVIDGKWVPLPREAIEIAMGIADVSMICDKLLECIYGGQAQEIVASESEESRKNAEAGQV